MTSPKMENPMSNEPVLLNSGLSVILAVLAPFLAKWGIDQDGAAKLLSLIGTVVAGIVSVWRIIAARNKVTPVANPNLP